MLSCSCAVVRDGQSPLALKRFAVTCQKTDPSGLSEDCISITLGGSCRQNTNSSYLKDFVFYSAAVLVWQQMMSFSLGNESV